MKQLIILFFILTDATLCIAQTINNPVFDRSDVPFFRVEKIDITTDTTYVHCSYLAEADNWACISTETYIEDVSNGKKYQILKVDGIPFYPHKREFNNSEIIHIIFYFPHISSTIINFIEDPNDAAFNIYGISGVR